MQKIFAHRGASAYAPENTLEAFDLAVKMGADGVELDVHMTKDGELVVAHDEEIGRVANGLGLIKNMTVAELKKHRFNRTHPEYRDATIPTLREVYELLKPTGLHVNTELKTSRIRYEHMEEKCVKLADELGMSDCVIYSSFNTASLRLLKRIDPNARVGLLRTPIGKINDRKLVDPWDLAHLLGIDAIHPHFSELLLYNEADKAHAKGMQVNVWTVNEEGDMRKCLEAGDRKPFDQLFFEGGFNHPLPQTNPYAKALEMARWAPSAGNGQPWRAVVDGDSVHFYEAKSMKNSPLGDIQKVDVGIALAHFDMTLEEEGVRGAYSFSDPGIPTPENTHYIVTYRRI